MKELKHQAFVEYLLFSSFNFLHQTFKYLIRLGPANYVYYIFLNLCVFEMSHNNESLKSFEVHNYLIKDSL